MKKFYLSFLFGLLLGPTVVFGLEYQGSGFGYSGANVCFTDSGSTNGGQPYYWNSTHDYFLAYNGAGTYVLTDNLIGPADYINTSGVAYNGWTVAGGGGHMISPGGNTTLGCPTPPVPSGPTSSGLDTIFSTATTTFKDVTGLEYTDITAWSNNMIKMITGSALGVFSIMLPWILALLVVSAIVFFIYRGFRFMKH